MSSASFDSSNVIEVSNVSKSYRLWHDAHGPVRYALASTAAQLVGRTARSEKYFRDFHALTNIGFEVKRGESFAVIGRNGSGKSTLLQIIAGTLQPTTGGARVKGRIAALLELGSGFNPEFTGRENVYLYAAILGMEREEIARRFESIANFAEIGDFIEQPVKTYSSGMALRLAFAVIAHVDATVLIIDEALAVGDVYFMQKCMRFLREFKERGTLLFVSHDMSSVRNLCNSALWLDQGVARMLGSAQEVAAAYLAEYNLSQKNAAVVQISTASADQPTSPVAKRTASLSVRNPIIVSGFNAQSASYGDGRVKILDARFVDEQGTRLTTINSGDIVCLSIVAKGIEPTGNIIFGFNFKDKLGQHLFGENTFNGGRIEDVSIHPGERYCAKFSFEMPVLHRGQYTVTVAVASGTPLDHRQQHWLHEAMVLSSALEWAHVGLVGIPMREISVEKQLTDHPR